MAPIILTVILTVLNILLAGRNLWKEWRAHRTPPNHPLEPALRDIAAAIRVRLNMGDVGERR